MNMRSLVLAMSIVLTGLLSHPVVAADVHQFWDQRCAECHGHSATFARTHLIVEDGKLLGAHHRQDLKRFMGQHQMGSELVDEIYDMLLAQSKSAPLFQQKCTACHGTAAEFARASLEPQDGKLVGKSNRQPLAEFLAKHGHLKPDEVPVIVDVLTRVHGEVH